MMFVEYHQLRDWAVNTERKEASTWWRKIIEEENIITLQTHVQESGSCELDPKMKASPIEGKRKFKFHWG
jgi:hypothetical protein